MTDPVKADTLPADGAATVKAPDGSDVPRDNREATPNDLEHQTGNPHHRGLNPNRGETRGPDPQDVDPRDGPVSINEPPGSEVLPAPPTDPSAPIDQAAKPPASSAPAPKPLPSDAELHEMTRAELDALAKKRGIDTTDEATKADVIARLKKG